MPWHKRAETELSPFESNQIVACYMCGAAPGDEDPYSNSQTVKLIVTQDEEMSKYVPGIPLKSICLNCFEGSKRIHMPKPARTRLLTQIRRATMDDQRAVLDWLIRKFNFEVTKADRPESKSISRNT